ncbi:MAG TPA: hypothetical protein VLX59_09050 [Acidimicrobiales bacterium]|nr:hypothetical protein [Acidimicrobiales bacterium]
MTAPPQAPGRSVRFEDLRVGELLAEGGEGRVFTLPLQPHLVLKSYRLPAPRGFLEDLVAWPQSIERADLAARVTTAAAWPASVAIDRHGEAAGLLMPRAPRRFALRHRDGTTRLASLSYLTADPAHREMAYGLGLPPDASPPRLGLVYALARLLQAFEAGPPGVGHGDLSTKNVLWSLQRGPEIFVIDCDNCERFGPDGHALGVAGRRRAMTPNWDDPAVPSGGNPTLQSDRYSLALIFLRVVGAANFPIQARQRQDGAIRVDFAMTPGPVASALSEPDAPIWRLCSTGLSVSDPGARPPASAWVAALEDLLDRVGAHHLLESVWAAQGGGAAGLERLEYGPAGDVVIRPFLGPPRPVPRWTMVGAATAPPVLPWHRPAPVPTAFSAPGGGPMPPATPTGVAGPISGPGPVLPVAWAHARRGLAWWVALHRETFRALIVTGGRAYGVRSLLLCALVDFLLAVVGLFLVAMLVAPVLGI